MKICLFGMYDPLYARNRVFIEGFKKNNIEVIECRVAESAGTFIKYFLLFFKGLSVSKTDYVFVLFPGHLALFIAQILFWKTPIIFDPFVSLYNSEVEDRKKNTRKSFRAWWYAFLDKTSCTLADIVLFDTKAHKEYFQKKYNVPEKKSVVVYLGTTPSLFYPKNNKREEDVFLIHFHGGFIPLQGVLHIIEAAALLYKHTDIKFRMIGTGQEYNNVRKLADEKKLRNIEFLERVSLETLNDYINESDICLGIFGTTPKTPLVIPNKVYEAVAAGVPVITAQTPAIRELFTDEENISLVPAGNAQALAEKILLLKSNSEMRNKIAHNAHALFEEKLTPVHLVRTMMERISHISIDK
jgi:glycosyltransferase involved in cell wall biosynthesis